MKPVNNTPKVASAPSTPSKATPEELMAAKTLLSPFLLKIKGVSGVGVSQQTGQVNVYVADLSPATQKQVRAAVQKHAPGTDLRFVVSGGFSSMSSSLEGPVKPR